MEKLSKLKTPFLFLLNTALVLSLRVKIFPELFIYPWLVSKGQLPYRDFFDHHGFLTYYLLAPFIWDKSLFLIKIIYFLLQTFTLWLFLKIIRQHRNYFFLGLLFVLLNFFMLENVLWYENFTVIFYLLIYIFSLKKKFRFQAVLLAVLIWLASLIKPPAGLIIIPVFFLTKNWRIILYLIGFWIITIGFFFLQKSFFFFIDNLFFFNFFCSQYSSRQPIILFDIGLLKFSLLILAFCLLINCLNKKLHQHWFLLTIIGIAFLFFFPGYSKTHTAVIIPFFVIYLGKIWEIKDRSLKPILIFLTVVYFLYIVRLNISHYQYLAKQPLEHYGDLEIIYKRDKIPGNRFPIVFPWTKEYYHL